MRNLLLATLAVAAIATSGARPASACVSDDDCSPPTPICDLDVCVQCLLDIDCPSSAPNCSGQTCEACLGDADCTRFAGLPACHPSGACAQCSATNDSLCEGTTPVCNVSAGSCAPCSSNGDCAGSPDGPVCSGAGSCGNDPGSCAVAPLEACMGAEYSTIRITATGSTRRDGIQWSWVDGTIEAPDFGDPTTTTVYSLCVYRNGGPFYSADLPPGFDFWKWTGAGFRYRNRGNADGIQKMKMRTGDGDAKINLKGKGVLFAAPDLPVDANPVVVQLVASGPAVTSCWSAHFENPYDTDSFTEFREREDQ